MADVRLITLIPPPNPVSQPANPQSVTTQGSPTLPQLPNGSVLSGFIINRDVNGNPILRTEGGDIHFASNFFLKIGSEVVIRIQHQANQQHAHIVSVNGLPPEEAAKQTHVNENKDVIVNRNQQPLQQPNQQATSQTSQSSTAVSTQVTKPALQVGQTIPAIIVIPAFVSGEKKPATSPGTSLLLSVLGLNHSKPSNTSQSSTVSQLTSSGTAPPNSPLSSLLPTAGQPTPASGTAIAPSSPQTPSSAANIAATATSNQQAATANIAAPLGQSIVATASIVNDDGSVIFNSTLGTLRIANAGNIQPGQQVTFNVSSVAEPNDYTTRLANAAPSLPPAPLTALAKNWTSLQQIAQLLGEDITSQIIPTFPATPLNVAPSSSAMQAGSQILFFLSVLKGGNFSDWLGTQNIRTLENKGYKPLLMKADAEFSLLARQFAEPQQGNWQTIYFPVAIAQEVAQIRSFVKREKKKNEQGDYTGDEDTRFVIEMDLTQLGEMQMDGLVKRKDEKLQFDLVIRSIESLPKELESDIQAIYHNTAELTGFTGQLAFKTVFAFPIHPLEDITPHVFDDVVV